MRSAPEAYHSTIIHYAEPRVGLEEILRSVDVVFNVCYGYREKSQAEVAGWLDDLGLCHTSPTKAAQDLAQDKASYPKICACAGVPTPEVLEREELNSIAGLVLAKPRFGGCHKGVEIDLGPVLDARLNTAVDYIFQRYLDGANSASPSSPTENAGQRSRYHRLKSFPIHPGRSISPARPSAVL